MNETALLKLKVIVERAVRPVPASISWKRKMRQELLAHVTGVFEEELPRCDDEAAALIQVEKRFGDPGELALTLQESVPTTYRYVFLFERLIEPRIGETLVRRAARFGIMLSLLYASLTITLLLLILPFLGKANQLGSSTYILLLLSISLGAMMFVATLLTSALERALFETTHRSPLKVGFLVVVSCFITTLPSIVLAFGMSLFESDVNILESISLTGTVPAALAVPWLFVWLAKQFSDEKRYRDEWAKLQID